MARSARGRAVLVRRAQHLVAHWRDRTLRVHNYATGIKAEVPPNVCELLSLCDDWTTLTDLASAGLVPPSAFSATIRKLVRFTLLERSDRRPHPRVTALDTLSAWNPQAGFFHLTTKDVRFAAPQALRTVPAKDGTVRRPPAAIKRYTNRRTTDLPRPDATGELATALRTRRTWRRYSKKPVTLDELATILALSAGVHVWVKGADIPIPLKTSPSGGARHATEVYVVAQDVDGLKPGIYHYAPARHGLTRIAGAASKARVREYVPGSEYFADAPVMVFFTSVFARILWRYPYARAYRAALIEAGHVCQSFLLMATSLGLAPFSVMALADSVIENDLGIDGIQESVLYAAGIGRPPRGVAWAPLAKGPAPKVRRNPRV